MDATQNTAVTAQDHHGSGFKNVIDGLKHLPHYVIEALHNHASVFSMIVNSKPVQEIIAYENTHRPEQIAAIKKGRRRCLHSLAEYQRDKNRRQ